MTFPSEPTRLAVGKREAAAMLGVSVDSFERYPMHELPVVYIGRRRLYRVTELERWLRDNEQRPGLEAA